MLMYFDVEDVHSKILAATFTRDKVSVDVFFCLYDGVWLNALSLQEEQCKFSREKAGVALSEPWV